MPFRLDDPSQPITPDSPTLSGALSRDALALLVNPNDFQRPLDALAGPIEAAAETARADARVAIEAAPEYGPLAGAGPAFRDAWVAYDAAAKAIARNAELTAAGRDSALKRAAGTRDAAVARIVERVMSQTGDALIRRFPATGVAPMPADVAARATLLVTSGESMLPKRFVIRGIDTLRRASDPATQPETRFRLNWELDGAFLPLLERFSSAPPKHWQPLAGVAARLAGLVRAHLATAWGDAQHDAAVSAVERFRAQFRWLAGMAGQHGEWDGVYVIGAPAFNWSADA